MVEQEHVGVVITTDSPQRGKYLYRLLIFPVYDGCGQCKYKARKLFIGGIMRVFS